MKKKEEKNKYLVELGKQIREVRNSKGWTQETLADKAGVTTSYVGEIERGERNVTVLTLIKIAKQLECDAATFLKNIPKDI
ncbi:MAG: helix-turn-helix domain-containing protein [Tannerellaceae bacterium]|nr:helix-turn-helix domain-containing protein [Tannerellaceae bacterium]